MKRTFRLALGWALGVAALAAPVRADIGLSLAYVDLGGQPYARFKNFVDQASQ